MQMSVDLERRHDLNINMDIEFSAVPCAVLSMDILDVSGTNTAYFKSLTQIIKLDLHPILFEGTRVHLEFGIIEHFDICVWLVHLKLFQGLWRMMLALHEA
jgi:hypothetical protein